MHLTAGWWQLVETGVVEPLLAALQEVEETGPLYHHLQQTKTGTAEEMFRHEQLVHRCFAKSASLSVLCLLTRRFNQ